MSIILHGTNGITYPDGVVQAVGGGITMYKWATNMTADSEGSDISNTASGVFTVGSGITVTLVAGDEIVVQIGEIYVESTNTSESAGPMGIYDGTTFYMMNSHRLGAVDGGMVDFPPSSSLPDTIKSGIWTESGGNVKKSMPDPLVFSQRALNLSTAEKTWKLAFKHTNGNGIKIVGTTLARWSMGVRRET